MKHEKEINYLIELVKCAVTDNIPSIPEKDIDWELIYKLSKLHKILSTVYFGISKLPKEIVSNIPHIDNYTLAYKKNLVLDANKTFELTRIKEQLGNHHVDYVLLKGSVIKYIYPDTSMRRMGDIDILFRNANEVTIDEIFSSLGYTLGNKLAKDSSYFNPTTQTYVEMQETLIDYGFTEWFDYLKDIWDRCVTSPDSPGEYIMTNEDFYIYHILHMAKHFKNGGIGITHVLDVYIMWQKYDLNYDYINLELEKIGLVKFHNVVKNIVNYWFKGEIKDLNSQTKNSLCQNINHSLSPDETDLIAKYILRNGAFGKKKQQETNAIVKRGDSKVSLRKKIFPEMETMVNYYGVFLDSHKCLLPFYWLRLNFERLFLRGTQSRQSLSNISAITKENISDTRDVMKICGL